MTKETYMRMSMKLSTDMSMVKDSVKNQQPSASTSSAKDSNT